MPGRVIDAFIEIPAGSRNTYEYDERLGRIQLDRVLYSAVHYPTDYGFMPETLAPDGDHLNVLVLTHAPTFPGCVVAARPISGLDMEDEQGSDFQSAGRAGWRPALRRHPHARRPGAALAA